MAKKFYETAEFKKLNAKWYKKLGQEQDDTDVIQPEIINGDLSLDYYQLCQSILSEFDFKRPIDKTIFELHTQGMPVREIEEWLQENSIRKLKKDAISEIINRTKEAYLKGSR